MRAPAACPDALPGLRDADFQGCRWIEGEPTPLRHGMFCGRPVLLGSSWCAKHRGIVWAYQRVRQREHRSTAGGAFGAVA